MSSSGSAVDRRVVQAPKLLPSLTLGLVAAVLLPASTTVLATDSAATSADGQSVEERRDAASAPLDPVSLIEAMSVALNTLNYEGIFVHAQGVSLSSMHILHAKDENGEHERLRALDGEAREVIRNNTLVTCIWPDSQSVVISKSKPRDLLPTLDASFINSERYLFTMRGSDRVAGRDAHVVEVSPRDAYRYGYRFWIDKLTDMLLRSMLLDSADKPIEQIIFTQIDYPDSIDVSRFDVGDNKAKLSWLEPKQARAASGLNDLTQQDADRVGFRQLPMGYRKISETYSKMPIKDGPVSHVMLSDGMASVSVYVEYVRAEDQTVSALGLSRMGAMNAYGISTQQALITAVGEVPAATVKAIASAVLLSE